MVREWLVTDEITSDPLPFYKGFTGAIERTGPGKYATYGKVELNDKGKAVVTELPVGMWTDKFKEMVESWIEEKKIKNYKMYSTATVVHFEITLVEDGIKPTVEDMKLKTTFSTQNMVMFNHDGKIVKYPTIQAIVKEWCECRMAYYTKRREHMLRVLQDEMHLATNKLKFIRSVVTGKLVINNIDEDIVEQTMEEIGIEKRDGSYGYLLGMAMRSVTKARVAELEQAVMKLEKERNDLNSKTAKSMWEEDLGKLSV
jgi:DNA topoisomerase-2